MSSWIINNFKLSVESRISLCNAIFILFTQLLYKKFYTHSGLKAAILIDSFHYSIYIQWNTREIYKIYQMRMMHLSQRIKGQDYKKDS